MALTVRRLGLALALLGCGAPPEQDADPDGDGLSTQEKRALGTDPRLADTDGDGLDDGEEVALGTSPTAADTDLDGAEAGAGTSPLGPDSDDDGFRDGAEVAAGSAPDNARAWPWGEGRLPDRGALSGAPSTAWALDAIPPDEDWLDGVGRTVQLSRLRGHVVRLDLHATDDLQADARGASADLDFQTHRSQGYVVLHGRTFGTADPSGDAAALQFALGLDAPAIALDSTTARATLASDFDLDDAITVLIGRNGRVASVQGWTADPAAGRDALLAVPGL